MKVEDGGLREIKQEMELLLTNEKIRNELIRVIVVFQNAFYPATYV